MKRLLTVRYLINTQLHNNMFTSHLFFMSTVERSFLEKLSVSLANVIIPIQFVPRVLKNTLDTRCTERILNVFAVEQEAAETIN